MMKEMLIDLLVFIKNNKGKVFGTLLGFLVGVSILVIGFFNALFIFICSFIGYFIGSKSYKNVKFINLLKKIFSRN